MKGFLGLAVSCATFALLAGCAGSGSSSGGGPGPVGCSGGSFQFYFEPQPGSATNADLSFLDTNQVTVERSGDVHTIRTTVCPAVAGNQRSVQLQITGPIEAGRGYIFGNVDDATPPPNFIIYTEDDGGVVKNWYGLGNIQFTASNPTRAILTIERFRPVLFSGPNLAIGEFRGTASALMN